HDTPLSAARSRLPWLVTLLFLGMGTATLISQYDALIAEASVLSAFVTLITGTAGNAGTQSLAVAVRKLTNKYDDDNFFSSIMFELITGAITGFIVGITVLLIVLVCHQNLVLGAVIGIPMLAEIMIGT